MRKLFHLLPLSIKRICVVALWYLLAVSEKFWFLHYQRSKRNHFEVLRDIRENPLCPSTVETVFKFWIAHPEHEAFSKS